MRKYSLIGSLFLATIFGLIALIIKCSTGQIREANSKLDEITPKIYEFYNLSDAAPSFVPLRIEKAPPQPKIKTRVKLSFDPDRSDFMTEFECVSFDGDTIRLFNLGGAYVGAPVLAENQASDGDLSGKSFLTTIGVFRILKHGDYYQLTTPTVGTEDAYRTQIEGVFADSTGQWPYIFRDGAEYYTAFAAQSGTVKCTE